MGAIFPTETSVAITDAGTAGSSVASSDYVTLEVTNFSVNGGGKEIEAVPVFGNAFINKELPREQYELAIDVIVQYSNATRWDGLMMGGQVDSTSAESSSEALPKRIFVTSTDGTSYRTMAMDNASAVTWEPEMSADEYLKGTITFKFSPTDSSAASNLKVANVAVSDAYFN